MMTRRSSMAASLFLAAAMLGCGGDGGSEGDARGAAGLFGWDDKGEDCYFDVACPWDLVCRPDKYRMTDEVDFATGGMKIFRSCLAPGRDGELCEEDGDCVSGRCGLIRSYPQDFDYGTCDP